MTMMRLVGATFCLPLLLLAACPPSPSDPPPPPAPPAASAAPPEPSAAETVAATATATSTGAQSASLCPTDLIKAQGMSCTEEGKTCTGDAHGRFTHLTMCSHGRWTEMDAPPPPPPPG